MMVTPIQKVNRLAGPLNKVIPPYKFSRIAGWLLLPIVGVLLVLITTHRGAFLGDDSYYYIKPARDALAGQGLHVSSYFAPFIPLLLTGIGWFGIDPVDAFHYLNVFLFGLSVLLAILTAKEMGVRSGFALFAGALFVLSDTLIENYSRAMSEGLAFTLLLATFYLLFSYFRKPSTGKWVGAAAVAALACLTRYAAVSIAPVLFLALLFFETSRRFVTHLRDAFLAVLIVLTPLALYLLRNVAISGRPTRYSGYFASPLTHDQIVWYLYSMLSWFIPGRFIRGREILAGLVVLIILLAVGLICWHVDRHTSTLTKEKLISPAFLTLVGYGLSTFSMLIIARGFEGLGAFDLRYLSPILITLLLLITKGLDRIWALGVSLPRFMVAGFVLIFLIYYGYRTVDFVGKMYRIGLGYTNIGWYNSETVPYLKNHPDLQLVSTGEMGIYFWTGRKPAPINAFGGVDALRQHLCDTGAVLILLDQMPTDIYGMDSQQVVQGLELVKQFNDSSMYRCPAK